jgi:hypothetical protein
LKAFTSNSSLLRVGIQMIFHWFDHKDLDAS